MIDARKIRYNGKLNYQNGLLFYFSGNRHIISFLVKEIDDGKKWIRIRMEPDQNHGRPHIHINEHGASFAIDTGELLDGKCDKKTRERIGNWIRLHRDDLNQLWGIVKSGGRYEPMVERIQRDLDFEEFGFKCKEPKHKERVQGVLIWHNEKLTCKYKENSVEISCDGDIYVGVPKGVDDSNIVYNSTLGDVVKKYMK